MSGELAAPIDSAPNPPPLTRMEQITILTLEYSALRSELLQRHTSAFQIFCVFGTAAITIITLSIIYSLLVGIILLCILSFISWVAVRYFYTNLSHIVAQLIELEKRINDKAGAQLLSWEIKHALFSDARRERTIAILGPVLSAYHWAAKNRPRN